MVEPEPGTRHKVVLCADDFGLTDGISDAIEQLAELGHLSAASAIVTEPTWPFQGRRLSRLRDRIAVRLHINLTPGAPLGAMQKLAARGRLPNIADLSLSALSGGIDVEEVAGESLRQITRFAEVVGAPPDFLDGHQHAHVLPGVRQGVLRATTQSLQTGEVLLRDPSDTTGAILRRRVAIPKALGVALLARGFGAQCQRLGINTNIGFSGFSNFGGRPYAEEFARYFAFPGPRHLVMCHPGLGRRELSGLDPIAERREEEFSAIKNARWLETATWKPRRDAASLWSQQGLGVRA